MAGVNGDRFWSGVRCSIVKANLIRFCKSKHSAVHAFVADADFAYSYQRFGEARARQAEMAVAAVELAVAVCPRPVSGRPLPFRCAS